jgi:hypothetical protein
MELPNLCIECGVDMGDCNPRQLCGKIVCVNSDPWKDEQPVKSNAEKLNDVDRKKNQKHDRKSDPNP